MKCICSLISTLMTVNLSGAIYYRRMAENGFAPPLGNFADISYLVEN